MTNLSPWMVESAHRYLCAAELLRYQLLDVAQINAALGMEILFKSFVAKPNSNHGELTETYRVNNRLLKRSHKQLQSSGDVPLDRDDPDGHDLLTLFYAIPESVRHEIGLERRKVSVKRYRHVFTQSRYPYEKTRKKRQCASVLIDILRDLIPSVVDFYRKHGCEDPFIQSYSKPEVEVIKVFPELDLDRPEVENRPPRPPMPSSEGAHNAYYVKS